MPKGVFKVPVPTNEPVKSYAPGTPEREELQNTYNHLFNQEIDIPMFIGGKEIFTNDKRDVTPPHDHGHKIGQYSYGTAEHVHLAIDTALAARANWAKMSWEHRAAIFLKAAELISTTYRARINAATMLAQSKNAMQAEIDAACEFADFLRFNVQFMMDIYNTQPASSTGVWNRVEYRPLEGFVVAITPFNFTAISGNLPASAALMGNVVVWKPSDTQIYSAHTIMNIFREAGLPGGVINMVFADGPMAGDILFKHPDFSALHFTGSTSVFKYLWKEIGSNVNRFKTYPRIVGETGGKDFIVMHPTANADEVSVGISRGAFEFQGQKCSATSRVYLPKSKAQEVIDNVIKDVKTFKMGGPEDFSNFITAVIDEKAFDKIAAYIDFIKEQDDAEIVVGGNYDKSKGYFIEPTVVVTSNPKFRTMCEEIFGPVVTIYTYEDNTWEETLQMVDQTSEYALTGAIFSKDRYAAEQATKILENAAGNFYINDKPSGAVVGQQPFGGARGSGTNDKAGSAQNLLRWCSPRLIKETLVPPTDYRYPFLD